MLAVPVANVRYGLLAISGFICLLPKILCCRSAVLASHGKVKKEVKKKEKAQTENSGKTGITKGKARTRQEPDQDRQENVEVTLSRVRFRAAGSSGQGISEVQQVWSPKSSMNTEYLRSGLDHVPLNMSVGQTREAFLSA